MAAPFASTLLSLLVVLAFAASLVLLWRVEGRDPWRTVLTDRFLYGVPWGTLVVVAVVLATYLFAQGGLWHWYEPLVLPFRAWSYLYPTGIAFSSLSHSSPSHLLGNLTATLALGPIVEYAWSHYPPRAANERGQQGGQSGGGAATRDGDATAAGTSTDGVVPTDDSGETGAGTTTNGGGPTNGGDATDARDATNAGDVSAGADDGTAGSTAPGASPHARLPSPLRAWLRRPAFRAFVAFPIAVLAVGLFTGLFFLGPVIGFSGVVFALGGAALVQYPIATLVALLLSGVLSTLRRALLDPVVVASISGSPPSVPWWAEIALQAHWLGVLVGVLAGLGLLAARGRRPPSGRLFLAALVYGFAQNLWAIPWLGSEGTYTLYQGPGVVLVVAFAAVVVATAVVGDRPVTEPLATRPRLTGRRVAVGWLGVLVLAVGTVAVAAVATVADVVDLLDATGGTSPTEAVVLAGLAALVLALPVAPALLPSSVLGRPPTNRHALLAVLVVSVAVLAAPAAAVNLSTTGDDAVPGSGTVDVGDYVVTYEEDVRNRLVPVVPLPGLAAGTNVTTSGVVVVSEARSVWFAPSHASEPYLASEGNATVVLGGLGWRETVRAERSGWSVVGNDSVYVVDLATDDRRVQSFASDPSRADALVRGLNLTVAPTTDGFAVRATRDGERVDVAPVPRPGESSPLADLDLRTVHRQNRTALVVAGDRTRVRIATRERYGRT